MFFPGLSSAFVLGVRFNIESGFWESDNPNTRQPNSPTQRETAATNIRAHQPTRAIQEPRQYIEGQRREIQPQAEILYAALHREAEPEVDLEAEELLEVSDKEPLHYGGGALPPILPWKTRSVVVV